jgi:hypothetical protein
VCDRPFKHTRKDATGLRTLHIKAPLERSVFSELDLDDRAEHVDIARHYLASTRLRPSATGRVHFFVISTSSEYRATNCVLRSQAGDRTVLAFIRSEQRVTVA